MGGKPCIEDGAIVDGELVACRFWVTVHGKHPQTGVDVSGGDCAFCWTPMLMIENTKVNRETGAAIESLRNESIIASHQMTQVLTGVSNTIPKLVEGETGNGFN